MVVLIFFASPLSQLDLQLRSAPGRCLSSRANHAQLFFAMESGKSCKEDAGKYPTDRSGVRGS
jgi:hypothetical protein